MATLSPSICLPLYRLGGTLFVGGCLWGCFVHMAPFPRLALAGHIGLMSNAMASICAGVVIGKFEELKVYLSPIAAACVYWGLFSAWPMAISECINSFWGGNEFLPIVSLYRKE
jgi:hypothetical protein